MDVKTFIVKGGVKDRSNENYITLQSIWRKTLLITKKKEQETKFDQRLKTYK